MKETLVVMSGLAVIVFVGGELVITIEMLVQALEMMWFHVHHN